MKVDHYGLQMEAMRETAKLRQNATLDNVSLAIQMRQADALERIAAVLEDAAKIGGALNRS